MVNIIRHELLINFYQFKLLSTAGSSRSHSIFIINVEQISKAQQGQCDTNEDVIIRKGKLNLVCQF